VLVATPMTLPESSNSTGQSIRAWVAVADRREGRRGDVPPVIAAAERDELAPLRREVRQLRLERDILSKAAAWFTREAGTIPSGSSGS
jgi:transposase